MKKITLLFLLMFTIYTFSQEKNYGISASVIVSDSDISDELSSGGSPGFKIGIYYDYQLSNRFGLKPSLAIGRIKDGYFDNFSSTNNPNILRTNIDLLTLLKYDMKNNYFGGSYLLFGPRITYITSAKNGNNKIENFYKETNLGVILGFGFNISKSLQFEFQGDYGFTDIILSNDYKTKTIGGSITLLYNLSNLIK